jgi:hypothetical protein
LAARLLISSSSTADTEWVEAETRLVEGLSVVCPVDDGTSFQ